jgi:hypothetical protein
MNEQLDKSGHMSEKRGASPGHQANSPMGYHGVSTAEGLPILRQPNGINGLAYGVTKSVTI